MQTLSFDVNGTTFGGCTSSVQRGLSKLDGDREQGGWYFQRRAAYLDTVSGGTQARSAQAVAEQPDRCGGRQALEGVFRGARTLDELAHTMPSRSIEVHERGATPAGVAIVESALPKLASPRDPDGTETSVDAELQNLQRETFGYFLHETNPANGLATNKTAPDWPASIAATGLALGCYPVSVERGFMTRAAAVERTLTTLRFFWNSAHGPELDATGYQGFYHHFLDMQTGRRAWQRELSTVDSTFLVAGALMAAMYFDADSAEENEIRTLRNALYRRANWAWAWQPQWVVGVTLALRAQPGPDHFDDREPSVGLVVAADASLPVHRQRLAPSGVHGRLASNLNPAPDWQLTQPSQWVMTSVQEKFMTTANLSQASTLGMPPALSRAQAAIHLPEVQAMLQRLSDFDLGIFMPHQHDERTGDFQPLPDDVMQVESGCKVSFQNTQGIVNQADRFLPVAWRWRAGASSPASACEMVAEEGPDGAQRPVKHKMPVDD